MFLGVELPGKLKIAGLGAVVAVASLIAVPAAGAASTSSPSKAQIATAVAKATRSSELWVTINSCRRRGKLPGVVGVRAQMPGLGFPTQMRVTLTVSYFSATTHRYQPLQGTSRTLTAPGVVTGTSQTGLSYMLSTPVTVIAHAQFKWYYRGKLIGSAVRASSGGHKQVKGSDPSGYSVAACWLPG